MYMGVLPVCICLYTTFVPGANGDQRKVLDSLGLELQMDVSCLLGSGNQT